MKGTSKNLIFWLRNELSSILDHAFFVWKSVHFPWSPLRRLTILTCIYHLKILEIFPSNSGKTPTKHNFQTRPS
jgi:hypothetical protein